VNESDGGKSKEASSRARIECDLAGAHLFARLALQLALRGSETWLVQVATTSNLFFTIPNRERDAVERSEASSGGTFGV
jgi:hypothetical protein